MKLYHPTMHATEILREGFGERSGSYLTQNDHSGVWLYDRPVDKRMGGGDEAVMLEVEMPESIVVPFEWVTGPAYRQFLIPAALLNTCGRPRVSEEQPPISP